MGTMEDVIRRAMREEISRALSAVGKVAEGVYNETPEDSAEERAAYVLMRTMERVARDVLANRHPVLSTEHAGTEVVHVVTDASTGLCSVCSQSACTHKYARCLETAYVRGLPSACQCTARPAPACLWCEHAAHRGTCGAAVLGQVQASCMCDGVRS